ncbi:MAG: hypothetical protein LVS60_15200 [Nodosilinea sp. LVE1205-7]|jgi:hypothetical protein
MFQNPAWGFPPRATSHNPNLATPSRRQVHAPMADQGSPDAMGRQACDRPPKGVIDRPNWDTALGAAISPPLLLLELVSKH